MRIFPLFLLIPLIWASGLNPAWSSSHREVAGVIKAVSGQVSIIRQDEAQPVDAVVNMKLSSGDTVRTGKGASIGLIFRDDAVVSLGPDSEFRIDDFQFSPLEQKLLFIGRLLHGTINFISGQITRLAPDNVRIETPDATLGVRGTQILVETR